MQTVTISFERLAEVLENSDEIKFDQKIVDVKIVDGKIVIELASTMIFVGG